MTLSELLQQKKFTDLSVINKNADLDRIVSTVESSETPDIVAYVPQNTLLLTTAMSYKDSQDELCDLIKGLNELPCAGIAIKLGRFVDELDKKVIETADALGFPLLRIPMNRTLGDVYHKVLACIWNNENEDLIYALNIQKKFYNLILQGASLKKLLSNLGLMLKCPVMILDIFGEVLSSSRTTRQDEQMAVQSLERLNLNDREYWQYRRYVDDEKEAGFHIYPIRPEIGNTHYLVVFNKEEPNLSISVFVIEQILLILGMHFYKGLYQSYNEILLRENFLYVLVDRNSNESISPQQILIAGQSIGLRSCAYYKIIVARFSKSEERKFQSNRFMRKEERYILIYGWLKDRLEKHYNGDILILPDTNEWRYVILMQESEKNIEKRLKEIHKRLLHVFEAEIIFSFGNNVFEVKGIDHSYRNAVEGLYDISPGCIIRQYQPKNIMDLIKSISGSQVDEVCINVLKSLAYPQDEMTIELKKTLKIYLDCHCSIMETANRLYLHRNTVRYRIKKCEEILENGLNDPEYCFQLQFSLMLSEL